MLERLYCKCLLRPEDLAPSRDDLEVIGVFNPGAVEHEGETVLLLRVAERPREKRDGYVALPRYTGHDLAIDWVRKVDLLSRDPRTVTLNANGHVRLNFVSHLRVARSRDGRTIDGIAPGGFFPEDETEEFGVEDPRIVALDGRYYITYVAVSHHGAATALASTGDFLSFTRHGIIFPCENKDVLLFPEPVNGAYVAYHRPNPSYRFSAPAMWIAGSPDLIHWGGHAPLHAGKQSWESGRIGGGAPPLRTPRGWLEIYHGSVTPRVPGNVGAYVAGAFLADIEDPASVLGVSTGPIMAPERDFERFGFVNDVVFPTGAVLRDDLLQVYYGAADTYAGVVEFGLKPLLEQIESP